MSDLRTASRPVQLCLRGGLVEDVALAVGQFRYAAVSVRSAAELRPGLAIFCPFDAKGAYSVL